ncbi:MAG TPA: type II secretion system F family protein [Clostridia bacterium]|nr:type II secretion system F family protein [Clostridia bacterium]
MVGFIIAISVTLFLGVMLLVFLVTSRSPVSARLKQVTSVGVATVEEQPKIAVEALSSVAKLLAPIRKAIGLAEDLELGRRLALAGYRSRVHIDVFYTVKLLAPVAGGLIAGFVIQGDVILWFLILASAGFFGPDFWLTSAIASRREKIRLALPDALDLLVICMEAGLGMDQALIRVGEELRISHPELSEEFLLINLEQRAGKPRAEAWRNMAERTALETVRSFVNMLVQTERFGTPLSKSLGSFADSLRTQRRQKAEELAARTTVKLVFPLVLFIFPSMFIVLLGPAIISITKSFAEAFGK